MLLRHVLRYKVISPLAIWNTFESTTSKPILPEGSTLHRINEYFTPLVESQPEFNKNELNASLSARGLMKLHSEKILEDIEIKNAKLDFIKKDIECCEKQRLDIHAKFQEAECSGDNTQLKMLREAAKTIKKEKNRHREAYRFIAFNGKEELLQMPNKLRDVPRSLPDESWFCQENRPGVIKFFDIAESTVLKDCGTYLTGDLVTIVIDHLPTLLEKLCGTIDTACRTRCRLCNLSDFVRLPVVEACAWTSSLDKVIQMLHTKDDLHALKDSGQVLINPYTRICLVGSASLAAFVGSVFGSSLAVPDGELNFLTLGNIYQHESHPEDTASKYPFKQTRQIAYFGLFSDKDASVRTFDKLALTISEFWSDFQPHWRIKLSVVPDPDLRYCEMARWKVVMVTEDKSEVELASVSLLGDWVSRRGDIRSSPHAVFPFMVFGEMVNSGNFVEAVRKEGAFQPASK